ncbi:hypothetical protein LAZ67_22000847, partial [Cordylochernes scorpioides]
MEEQTNPSNDIAEQSVPKQETTFEEEETSPPQGTSTDPLTQIADALSKLLVARSPREIDVSPYDGTFEAQSFFDNFDAQADRAELTYTDRLRKLPCYLQGKPLQYFRNLQLDRLFYNDARQTLIDLFPATTEASFARFLAIKLTPQMPLEEYYQNKTVMGMKLNLPTDILIESLTDGLPVADQRLIATVQPNTIKEWFDLVSRITQCATSAVYQRQVDKAPHPTYHNPPPRYNNLRSSRVTYQVTPPPSPCKYCNAMHWHSQCEQRFQQSRTRPVYSARPRTTTVPKRGTHTRPKVQSPSHVPQVQAASQNDSTSPASNSTSTSTLTYIQTLKTVLQQGFPKRLLSDRAPAFTSEKFRKFLITHGIQPLLTTSNNPQANGLIERLNATITGKLRLAYLENPKASWTQLVKRVTQTYNNTPHSVTSFPPTYLMFNVVPPDLRTHINLYPEINIAREIARTRTQNKHKKDKETFDKQHRTPHFEVNDLVLVKNYRHPDTGKLAPYFTGPYKIIEIISPNVVRIDRPNQPLNRDSDTIHVNKLKYYTENVLYITPPHTRYVQKEQRMSPDVYLKKIHATKQPHFEVGDLVLVKLYHHPNTGKLAPYFTGPHTILEIISPNVVRIDRPNQPLQRDTDTIHVNKLKLYTEKIRYISPPAVSTYHIKHNPNYTFPFKHLTPELFPTESLRFKPTSSEPFRHLDPAIFATRRFASLFPDVKNCKPDNQLNHITPLPKDIKQENCEPTNHSNSTINKTWCEQNSCSAILTTTILREAHQKFDHPGISQLTRIISAQYLWSGMSIDIRAFVKNCNICQMSKTPKGPKYGELGELPESPLPFDLISMDTMAEFSRYGSAKNYLHVVVDHATRFAWTFPSRSTSTTTYIRVIKRVLQSGYPRRLLTDRAPAFTSPRFRRFLISYNIQPMLTTSIHPQANGLSERLNATLTGKLRLLHLQHPRASWTMLQSRVVRAYNDTPHSVTGFPPSYLMNGSLPKELSQHLYPYPSVTESRRLALQRTKERHKLDKIRFDKKSQVPDFE